MLSFYSDEVTNKILDQLKTTYVVIRECYSRQGGNRDWFLLKNAYDLQEFKDKYCRHQSKVEIYFKPFSIITGVSDVFLLAEVFKKATKGSEYIVFGEYIYGSCVEDILVYLKVNEGKLVYIVDENTLNLSLSTVVPMNSGELVRGAY